MKILFMKITIMICNPAMEGKFSTKNLIKLIMQRFLIIWLTIKAIWVKVQNNHKMQREVRFLSHKNSSSKIFSLLILRILLYIQKVYQDKLQRAVNKKRKMKIKITKSSNKNSFMMPSINLKVNILIANLQATITNQVIVRITVRFLRIVRKFQRRSWMLYH